MLLKASVSLEGVTDEMMKAAIVIETLTKSLIGREAIITAGTDGKHSDNSLHYSGNAMDFRTRDMKPMLRQIYRDKVADLLGNDFDVVLEATHLHVEYDPKE